MREECGLYAINYYKKNTSLIDNTIKGLSFLQHRGQDAAGISYLHEIISNAIKT